jgi:hypothetical protein
MFIKLPVGPNILYFHHDRVGCENIFNHKIFSLLIRVVPRHWCSDGSEKRHKNAGLKMFLKLSMHELNKMEIS